MEEREDRTVYKVVVNHEEQYSIWPAALDPPRGFKEAAGAGPGPLDDAVAYLKKRQA